ncbi:MAG: hypothetical protein IPK21_23510 [Haliscomenobacter sp.]|nr:hypothetical protein [Haliscomenobacter sp.]
MTRNRYYIGKIGITDLNIAVQEQEAARRTFITSIRDSGKPITTCAAAPYTILQPINRSSIFRRGIEDGRTGDGGRRTVDGRRETGDGTGDGGRGTEDGGRGTGDGGRGTGGRGTGDGRTGDGWTGDGRTGETVQ